MPIDVMPVAQSLPSLPLDSAETGNQHAGLVITVLPAHHLAFTYQQ